VTSPPDSPSQPLDPMLVRRDSLRHQPGGTAGRRICRSGPGHCPPLRSTGRRRWGSGHGPQAL